MVKIKSKKQKNVFRNIGLVLVGISFIYIIPSVLIGICNGFFNTAITFSK